MRNKILLAIAFAMVLTGCGDLFGPDKEGWKNSQKNEFLTILKTDKYMSLCDQKPLYEQVKSSKNSRLMTKLLLAYANNL
ncbi:MAG TPA: L,D-transpeptidase, partial [Epsilonproteobacteria bacterium]|nr:L,D-transpeptidase [Campylobacterota bacterium]